MASRGTQTQLPNLLLEGLQKKSPHSMGAVSFHFIWGFTEDCSPGDTLLDSPEDLLQKGGSVGEVSMYMILVKVHMPLSRSLLLVRGNR